MLRGVLVVQSGLWQVMVSLDSHQSLLQDRVAHAHEGGGRAHTVGGGDTTDKKSVILRS